MPQTVRKFGMAVAATTLTFFVAAAAHSDPTPENLVRGKFLKREVRTLVLPILTVKKSEYEGRPYKRSTVFQADTKLTENTDVLVRISAKQKKIFYIEFRF